MRTKLENNGCTHKEDIHWPDSELGRASLIPGTKFSTMKALVFGKIPTEGAQVHPSAAHHLPAYSGRLRCRFNAQFAALLKFACVLRDTSVVHARYIRDPAAAPWFGDAMRRRTLNAHKIADDRLDSKCGHEYRYGRHDSTKLNHIFCTR